MFARGRVCLRAGLAVVFPEGEFDTETFARVSAQLPSYARPRFVRIADSLTTTEPHKIRKGSLARDGVDPARVRDPLYVLEGERYLPLDHARWTRICEGSLRL